MKIREIEIIDEKEERMIDLLEQFEYDKHVAKTLVYILVKKTAVSSDIERAMDLQQPLASLATKELQRLGVISKKDIKHEGKGRPIHQYTLKKSLDEIKAFIENGARAKIKTLEDNLKTLNTLMKELKE